jgi:uncharacterized protein (TIGR02246 family)
MKYVLASFMLMITTVSGYAGPAEEAFSVVEQFKKAYDAADPQTIVQLFALDSVFLGTSMQKPTRDKYAILKYFQVSASANLPKRVEVENYETLQVSDTAVLFTGQDTFFQTRDGKSVATPARFTFLIIRGPEGWRIGHFHSSRRPEVQ